MSTIPSYLIPADVFTSPLEVTSTVREKVDVDGNVKHSAQFDNLRGWVFTVEFVRGTREKKLANGSVVNILDADTLKVTCWSDTRPSVTPGSYVILDTPMIGSYNSSIYVQCLGIRLANEEDEPSFSLTMDE